MLLAAAGCDVETRFAEDPTADSPVTAAPEPTREDSITAAALDFVRLETAVSEAEVVVAATSDDWARATVTAAAGETDPATVYLRKSAGTWRAVVIGTAFAPDELDRMGVPPGVRPPD